MIKYTFMRNRDFISRCLQTAERERARGENPSVRRIVALTVFGGACHYYVSYERAAAMVYKYHNIPVDERRPSIDERPSQVRARHITEQVEQISAKEQIPLSDALTKVLTSKHAPRFYFSVEYGMRLFNKYTSRKVDYKQLKRVV